VRRTKIVAPEELLRRLQNAAHERGVSMAALIREAIEEKL
jgi:predicted DNA-binding protein